MEKIRRYHSYNGQTIGKNLVIVGEKEVEKLESRLKEAEELISHFTEYWNGARNDTAMFDALCHIVDESEAFLEKGQKMKKIYISGPMTGHKDFNKAAFYAAEDKLQEEWEILNPADVVMSPGTEWSDYMRHDITMLMTAAAIYMLDGWQGSKGAILERVIAMQLGMEVIYE